MEELPTYGWYATGVDVKGQAELISENGNVNILSEDDMSGESVARGTTIGIGFNVSTTYGRNEAYGTNTINVDGILDAYASLIVKAASRANLKAETYADGGGLISGVGLKATNKLERTVAVNLLQGSSLSANFGDVDILATAGGEDTIVTTSKITSGGLVAEGTANVDIQLTSNVTVNLEEGVEILDRFNTLNVKAEASQNGVNTTVSVDASGLGVRPLTSAQVTTNLTAHTNVKGTAAAPVILEATEVFLIAHVAELDIYTYTYSKGSAWARISTPRARRPPTWMCWSTC